LDRHRLPWITRLVASVCIAMAISITHAEDVERTPLPPNHPLVGLWRFDVPNTRCREIYELRANGTTRITSGAQAIESDFRISAGPSPKGFYEWIDKVTKDNGKPDCSGERATVGEVTTNFIVVHPSGRHFQLCEDEDTETCVGPFIRQDGG
jgi:hypothetical protein